MTESWIPRVREWMENSGTSQGDLARALDCTRGAVGHYLAGRRQPTLAQLERIAIAIGVHPAWLLYGIGPSRVEEDAAAYRLLPRTEFGLPLLSEVHPDLPPRNLGYLDIEPLGKRCYGVQLQPGKGTPRAYEGETLILDPDSTPHPGDEVMVGFADGHSGLYELISAFGSSVTLCSVYDRMARRSCHTREITYWHRVIGVLRRNTLPMRNVSDE
jgi:prepilin-type processing-associated H-X9-DG protein